MDIQLDAKDSYIHVVLPGGQKIVVQFNPSTFSVDLVLPEKLLVYIWLAGELITITKEGD